MLTCQHCNTVFAPKPWPATRAIYCSSRCNKAAWRARNLRAVRQSGRRYNASAAGLAAKSRWNRSPKGVRNRRDWQRRNGKAIYARLKGPAFSAKVAARARSRAKLLAARPDMQCVGRAPHRGRIECHHKDGNPLNERLSNLEWRCKGHHLAVHPASRRRRGHS